MRWGKEKFFNYFKKKEKRKKDIFSSRKIYQKKEKEKTYFTYAKYITKKVY